MENKNQWGIQSQPVIEKKNRGGGGKKIEKTEKRDEKKEKI